MNFIDEQGYVFDIKSFDHNPIGYAFETLPYVFWIDKQYSHKLSINNYYIQPIRILANNGIKDISISIDSDVYSLVGTVQPDSNWNIELSTSSFKKHLSMSDFITISDDENTLLSFYVIGFSKNDGAITSNALIRIDYEDCSDFCPICVGGLWCSESEELIINGKNMGIDLPKDILKAVYRSSFWNETVDETLWNTKIKELLLNYMGIYGECGNLNSALKALSWFEYGDKLTLDRLVRTDNELFTQYVKDNLDLSNDLLESFDHFLSTSLLTLNVKSNNATNEWISQNYNSEFWGERKPILENLFNKVVSETKKDITYFSPYYIYAFNEFALKLSCLKAMYEKYFLPIHVSIYSACINETVYANDIKLIDRSFTNIVEPITLTQDNSLHVKFGSDHLIYLSNQEHYVDEYYNEYVNSKYLGENTYSTIYYVNELCFNIPIEFSGADIYNCKFILTANDVIIYESKIFSFIDGFERFVVVPKLLNLSKNVNYWLNKEYVLYVYCNDKWYDYHFTLALPELQMMFGKLKYKYEFDRVKQVNNITDTEVDFNSFMYLPDLVNVNNINFPKNVIDYTNKENLSKFIAMYSEGPNITNNPEYYNIVHYCKLTHAENGEELVYTGYNDPELYRYFFNDDGTYKDVIKLACDGNDKLSYDFFLMHDDLDKESYRGILSDKELESMVPCWYGVFISRETLTDKILESDKILNLSTFETSNSYKLECVATDTKFLLNRMTFIDSNGVNQFKPSDIICASINNVELPFILETGSHWEIKPFSVGMEKDARVYSTTNSCIISMRRDNVSYERGYYDISVQYSIDANSTEVYTKRAKIRVI